MNDFTQDELTLMSIYNGSGTRQGLIDEMTAMRAYLDADEAELRTLTDSAIKKLGAVTDKEYAALELYPILKNNSYLERAAFCGLFFPFTLARRRKDIHADQSRNVRADGQQRGYAAYRKLAGLGQPLTTAARLYKYPYQEQLMIYAQRPEATACAEYDLWNDKMGRYVKRGSQGIALLDDSGDRPPAVCV